MKIDEEVKMTCIRLNQTMTVRQIWESYYSKIYSTPLVSFSRMFRKWKAKSGIKEVISSGETTKDIMADLRKGLRLEDIDNNTKKKIDELKEAGYNIQQCGSKIKLDNIVIPSENQIIKKWDGEKIIRFGLIGDTQINSKYTQLTHLNAIYDRFVQEGIKDVYHTGDIDEGEQMRIGHQYECYEQGADDHVKEIVRVYPRRKGVVTQFITGNHDASIIKRCGYDIGVPIAQQRDDMIYLGQSDAIISFTDKCTMELRHPIDGTAYALSYKLQKMVESMSGGEKPNILAVGHYHKAEYFFYRNVHCFQTACFQAQTPWMKGKGISAAVGGWIVEIRVNDDGSVNGIKQEFFPFYESIKDDYLNWR